MDVPDSVGVGQPFLAALSSSGRLDALELDWNGRTVRPAVDPATRTAQVLLGTPLSAEPGTGDLEVRATVDGAARRLVRTIRIVPHAYQQESLSVAPAKITPPPAMAERIKRERELSLRAIRTETPDRRWELPLSLPVKGRMLSRFGLYRTFNGDIKRRHKGLDFRAYLGTPIHAVADGTVVLVGDFYFSGQCVFIDHGNGVVSMSVHLSKTLVAPGNGVARGQVIGLSGATGRATGAHLHLSVFVQGVNVDPEPLFTMTPPGAAPQPSAQ
jgi:murein DD-endopeptidase MepM/ murein hydrolase activator NlpD